MGGVLGFLATSAGCATSPVVAQSDSLAVASTAWRQGNANIARATFERGRRSTPRKLTSAPTLDRNVTLCAEGPDL